MGALDPNLSDYDLAGLRALLDAAVASRGRLNKQIAKIRAEIKRQEAAERKGAA